MRRYRFLNLIWAAFASAIALITMAGLFATDGWLEGLIAVGLQVVVVTSALAILIGILNLLGVHLGRFRHFQKGWFYSLIVIAAAATVIAVRVLDLRTSDTDESVSLRLFDAVQVSLESALAGLMFFFLVYAAYRMMSKRVTWSGCLFISALLIVLMGWLPVQGSVFLENIRNWLLEVPVTGGARGILIGIALGTVTVGLRVFVGQDRVYREQ
jgi:hypothetical protein